MRLLLRVSHPPKLPPILPSNKPNEPVDSTRCWDSVSKSPPCANLLPPFQNCLNRELLGRYMQWWTSMRCDKKKYCTIYSTIGDNQCFCLCCKEQNSRHRVSLSRPVLQQLVVVFLTPPPHQMKKKTWQQPLNVQKLIQLPLRLLNGVGEELFAGGGHLLTDAFAHSCTHTSEVTHKVWGGAQHNIWPNSVNKRPLHNSHPRLKYNLKKAYINY